MKTIKVFKLFRVKRDGNLYPLFINAKVPTPIGQWIPAEYVPTKGYAPRPGWHAGLRPCAPHLMSRDGTMQKGRIWAECEVPAEVDWQSVADAEGGEIKGRVPEGGHYVFKRPGLQGGSWVIAGALKVNRVLSPEEVEALA